MTECGGRIGWRLVRIPWERKGARNVIDTGGGSEKRHGQFQATTSEDQKVSSRLEYNYTVSIT